MRMFAFACAGAVAAGLGPRLTAAPAAGAELLESQFDRDDGARGRLSRGQRHFPYDGQRLVGRGEGLAHAIDRERDGGEVDVDLVGERFRELAHALRVHPRSRTLWRRLCLVKAGSGEYDATRVRGGRTNVLIHTRL